MINVPMTNASVQDIIRLCYHQGYIREDDMAFSSSGGTSLIMATSAQPASVASHPFDSFLPPVRRDTGGDHTSGYTTCHGPGGPYFDGSDTIINARKWRERERCAPTAITY